MEPLPFFYCLADIWLIALSKYRYMFTPVLSNLAKYLYSADLFPGGFHFTDFNLRFFITVQTEDSLAAAIVKQSGSCIFSII